MELSVGRERCVLATNATNQPHREGSVIGCAILQDLRTPFPYVLRRQPSEIASHCSQLVPRSLCVIGSGPLQGLAISSG